MEPKYVYGIVQAGLVHIAETAGVGRSEVYTVVQDGLACVLSNYSGREFSALSKEEVVRCLMTHQAVVEKIMETHTVLPVKFGTVLRGEAEVRSFLSQGRRSLITALNRLQDKVEMEVAATWDTAKVLQELAGQDDIVRARTPMTLMSPGEALQHKLRLGQIVKEALDQRRRNYSDRMLALLGPLALDLHPNVLLSDQMVMNVALLLHKDRQAEFDDRVRQLDDLFDDRINFRIIGPLPAYSFATVEVTRLDLERITAARRLLRLDEPLSEIKIRSAYRRLAADNHPDLNKNSEMAGQDLTGLREASDLLLAYCRGQVGLQEDGQSQNPTADSSIQSMLVNVRRLADDTPNGACLNGRTGSTSWQESYGRAS